MVALFPDFDATVDSDPAMKVLQVAAYDELLLRQDFNERLVGRLVAYATGATLDHIGAAIGVARLAVTPANAATGAAIVYEDDDSFRARIVLGPEGFAAAGPELAYVKRAKDAGTDVLDASAISPAPGEVLVTVLSRSGDGTAPDALVQAVRDIVTDPAVRPVVPGVKATWHDRKSAKRQHFVAGKADGAKTLAKVYGNEADAQAAANAANGRAGREPVSLSLTLALGRPDIHPETKANVTGYKAAIDGVSWLVAEVNHTFGDRGYTTGLKLEAA